MYYIVLFLYLLIGSKTNKVEVIWPEQRQPGGTVARRLEAVRMAGFKVRTRFSGITELKHKKAPSI